MLSCTGKNHRWNCDCKFGAAKRLPIEKKGGLENPIASSVPHVPRRYTKPNDRCSFCDATVFFRQLANGGRVYFDTPGAPWPKHPCTDTASVFYRGSPKSGAEDWPQVTRLVAEAESNNIYRLTGVLIGRHWIAFVNKTAFGDAKISNRYLGDSFIQARLRIDGQYDLAILTPDLKRKLTKGYLTSTNAALD